MKPSKVTKRQPNRVPLRKIKTLKATAARRVFRQNQNCTYKVRIKKQFLCWQNCNINLSLSCPILPDTQALVCVMCSN